jgi:hypothetical protein
MPCEILTDSVLRAALCRELSADQRAVLLRHLREPCEGCLDLLEGWTAEEMMLPSGGPPIGRDRERFLASLSAPTEQLRPLKGLRWHHWRLPGVTVGAAVAIALLGLASVLRLPDRHPEGHLKGITPPTTSLIPFAGVRTPTPHVVRALGPKGRLEPGEVLLLRIQLDTPAWVYLLSQKPGEGAELLWSGAESAPHAPGEFELAEAGSALAIDPPSLGTGSRLLLVASPEPIEGRRLQLKTPVRSRAELERAFPGCGVDVLPVAVEPP